MTRRRYTAELLKAQEQGYTVVCSVAPYEGRPVKYDPGYARTRPNPWWLPGTGLRFTGRECHAVKETP